MSNERSKNRAEDQNKKKSNAPSETDFAHTPDPENKMKGPVSSSVRKAGKFFEGKESREDADKRRDARME